MAKKTVKEPMAGAPFSPTRKLTVSARKGSGAMAEKDVKTGYRVTLGSGGYRITLGRGGKTKPR